MRLSQVRTKLKNCWEWKFDERIRISKTNNF